MTDEVLRLILEQLGFLAVKEMAQDHLIGLVKNLVGVCKREPLARHGEQRKCFSKKLKRTFL